MRWWSASASYLSARSILASIAMVHFAVRTLCYGDKHDISAVARAQPLSRRHIRTHLICQSECMYATRYFAYAARLASAIGGFACMMMAVCCVYMLPRTAFGKAEKSLSHRVLTTHTLLSDGGYTIWLGVAISQTLAGLYSKPAKLECDAGRSRAFASRAVRPRPSCVYLIILHIIIQAAVRQ